MTVLDVYLLKNIKMGSEETELVLAHLLAIANKSENVPHAAELLPATEFLYRQLDGQNSRPQPLTTLGYALAQLGSVLTAWESAGQLSPANTNALHTVWCNLCMAAEHAHEHVNTRYLNMELQLEVRPPGWPLTISHNDFGRFAGLACMRTSVLVTA